MGTDPRNAATGPITAAERIAADLRTLGVPARLDGHGPHLAEVPGWVAQAFADLTIGDETHLAWPVSRHFMRSATEPASDHRW